MIGILQNKKVLKDIEKIKSKHLKNVKNIIFHRKFKDKKIQVWNGKEIICDIDEIITMDFDNIVKFLEKYNYDITNLKVKVNNKKVIKKKQFLNWYKTFRDNYGRQLVKDLDIRVCPYCNRNFIDFDDENYTSAQLDHFFNKNKYYIFALSLSNLIPCCSDCNHNKLTNDFKISPYDAKYKTDDLLTFKYRKSTNNNRNYDIYIESNVKDYKEQAETLKLKERYSSHDYIVDDIKEKLRIYPMVYCEKLKEYFTNKDIDFDMLFYGVYFTEDKYYLRPLSKFTADILKQLKSDSRS